MSDKLDWLSPLELLDDYDGYWAKYVEGIYGIFREDFIDGRTHFREQRVGMKRHPVVRNKEATFWHLISSGRSEEERLPDLRRCERIRWPKAMIEAAQYGHVRCWVTERRREERIVIALPDFSYVVVLAKRGQYLVLWTAYCVEQKHRRLSLQRECERAQKG